METLENDGVNLYIKLERQPAGRPLLYFNNVKGQGRRWVSGGLTGDQAGGLGDQREVNGGPRGRSGGGSRGEAGDVAGERGITSLLRHSSKVKVKSVLNRHHSTTV
jgi:hypothetical protein